MKKNYVMWGVVVLFLVGSQIPVGFLYETARKRVSDPVAQTLDILQQGIWAFQVFEKRAPESLEELCASPYIVVECKDILAPFQNVALLQATPKKRGYFSLTPDPTRPPAVILSYVRGENSVQTYSFPNVSLPAHLIPSLLDEKTVEGWTPEMKTSFLAARFFYIKMDEYKEVNSGKNPKTLEEVYQVFPLLRKLRNPFSGGYAEAVVIPCFGTSPGPGDIPQDIKDGTLVFCKWKQSSFHPPRPWAYAKGKILEAWLNCDVYFQYYSTYYPEDSPQTQELKKSPILKCSL
ncbi:MAG: hypothetical protein V2G52_06385 [bacterium JZ-2024 1]